MSILAQTGLVEFRKDGRWRYYRLAGPEASPFIRQALEWVNTALEGSPVVQEDTRQLKKVLKKDVKALCERYKC